MKRLTCAVLCLVIGGCVSLSTQEPTQEEIESAYYGPEPTQGEELVRAYLEDRLKDPFSAQIRIKAEGKNWFRLYLSRKTTYGWIYKAEVNSKNSYGAYTGWKTYVFVLRGDTVVLGASPHQQYPEVYIAF